MRITILCIILSVFLLLGCDDEVKTSKEKVTDRLLSELTGCQHKYGANEYDDYRPLNEKYCNELLNMIKELIDNEFFDEENSEKAIQILKETTKDMKEEQKYVNTLAYNISDELSMDLIVGEI